MTDSIDNNRLLLEVENTIRELNREAINPAIEKLTIEDLKPALKLVARTRAEYLKELFELASVVGEELPSPDQIGRLRKLRLTYDELVAAAKALNIAIERGYLDVEH